MWHVITSVYRLSSNFLVQWFEWHRRKIQKPHRAQNREGMRHKLNHPSATHLERCEWRKARSDYLREVS